MFQIKTEDTCVIARINCDVCVERDTAIGPDAYTAVAALRDLGWFGAGCGYDDDGRRIVLCPACDALEVANG